MVLMMPISGKSEIGAATRWLHPATDCGSRGGRPPVPQLGLERGEACLQGLVLLAGKPRHVLDGFEFLALDQIEILQPALSLGAEQGVELAPDALRDAGGIVHQPRDLVEETVAGLGHPCLPGSPNPLLDTPASAFQSAAQQWA